MHALFITQLLAVVCVVRNGISETLLSRLLPELNNNSALRSVIVHTLHHCLVFTSVAGRLVFANNQVCSDAAAATTTTTTAAHI